MGSRHSDTTPKNQFSIEIDEMWSRVKLLGFNVIYQWMEQTWIAGVAATQFIPPTIAQSTILSVHFEYDHRNFMEIILLLYRFLLMRFLVWVLVFHFNCDTSFDRFSAACVPHSGFFFQCSRGWCFFFCCSSIFICMRAIDICMQWNYHDQPDICMHTSDAFYEH